MRDPEVNTYERMLIAKQGPNSRAGMEDHMFSRRKLTRGHNLITLMLTIRGYVLVCCKITNKHLLTV